EAYELEAVHLDALAHHRADHRVQPRAVTTAGQHTDTHPNPPFWSLVRSQSRFAASVAASVLIGAGRTSRLRRAGSRLVLAWIRAALFLVYEAGPGWARRRDPALTTTPEPDLNRLGASAGRCPPGRTTRHGNRRRTSRR